MTRPPTPRKKQPKGRVRTLYLGQWIARLGRKPTDIAKAVKLNEGYLSQLISGEKDNPSTALMLDIADELGVSVNALYKPPPERDIAAKAGALRPDLLEALGEFMTIAKGATNKNGVKS